MTDEPEASNEDEAADALFGEAEKPARKTRQAKAVVEEVRLHPILSNEEFLAAQAKARTAIDKERRATAMKAVQAEETERLRREEGYTTGSTIMDEIVHIQVDLPEWAPSIPVNGFPYMHGRGYDVPRHVYNSLREQMQRAWRHEDQIDGKSIREMMSYANRKGANMLDGNTGAAMHTNRFDA